jgi:hypothetical protein
MAKTGKKWFSFDAPQNKKPTRPGNERVGGFLLGVHERLFVHKSLDFLF